MATVALGGLAHKAKDGGSEMNLKEVWDESGFLCGHRKTRPDGTIVRGLNYDSSSNDR